MCQIFSHVCFAITTLLGICSGLTGWKLKYNIIDLETRRDLCSGRSSSVIAITPEQPALLRLGHIALHSPGNVKRCDLEIRAPPGFGVSMTVNSMNLDFRRNEFTGVISCLDYLQFYREWDLGLAQLAASIIDTLADKSDTICRKDYKMNTCRPELYFVGKTANVYYTLKNKLEMKYRRGGDAGADREFSVIATAFRAINGSCPDQYIRCGMESISFCISDTLRCDRYINCGFPGSGVDEQGCDGDLDCNYDSSIPTHTFIWVTLVLTIAVFLCCFVSCALRCWAGPPPNAAGGGFRFWLSNGRSPAGSGPTSSSGPGAGDPPRPSPLPSYDSVVRDLGSQQTGLESPPAYKDLFPESPGERGGERGEQEEAIPLNPLKQNISRHTEQ